MRRRDDFEIALEVDLPENLVRGPRSACRYGIRQRSLDLVRWGNKGLFDVAVVVSEDSDIDPAVRDVYALRDEERWIAVENALPWRAGGHSRWLPSARRRRPINEDLFERVREE